MGWVRALHLLLGRASGSILPAFSGRTPRPSPQKGDAVDLSGLIVHPVVLYSGLVLGALGVWFAMPRASRGPRELGAIVAAGGVGVVLLALLLSFGVEQAPNLFFYVFSLIGLGSALRVITHPRPVYSALFFILTIISSAGLYVLLSAEFLAFALIIIYAGAILITYLFVIMLATQAPSEDAPEELDESDRVARNPLGAVFAGFLLLAALTGMFNSGVRSLPEPERVYADSVLEHLPLKIKRELVAMGFPDTVQVGNDSELGTNIKADAEVRTALVQIDYDSGLPFVKRFHASRAMEMAEPQRGRYLASLKLGADVPMFASNEELKPLDDETFALFQFEDRPSIVMLTPSKGDEPAAWVAMVNIPDNIRGVNLEQVGMALLSEHPLALELAGVILLMALVGAVVIARKNIEHGEAETELAAERRPA